MKLAVASDRLKRAEASALAGLLARTGIRIEITEPDQAEVCLVIGGTAGLEPRAPVARMTRGRPSAEIIRKAMRFFPPVQDDDPGAPAVPPLIDIAMAVLADEPESDRDEHGRPTPESGLPGRAGLLDRPFLDELARQFGKYLWQLAGRAEAAYPPPRWTICVTLDIDSAGMFRGRAAVRNLRAIAGQNPWRLPEAAWLALRSRIGAGRDPHLCTRPVAESLEGLGVPATIFVQTHRRHRLDSYDLARAPRRMTRDLKAIIENRVHEVGLHSSYATRDARPRFFHKQWKRLRKVLGPGVTPVHRAHYLRAAKGVAYWNPWPRDMVDSSLGFGQREGFRRGTAFPWRPAEKTIELAPAVMDSTLRYFANLDAESAFERVCQLMEPVSRTGGAFVMIWHPNNMDEFLWPGWANVLYDAIDEGRKRGAQFQSLAHTARALQKAADDLESQLKTRGLL